MFKTTINYNKYNIINTNYIKARKYEKERNKGDDNNNIYIGLLKLLGPTLVPMLASYV